MAGSRVILELLEGLAPFAEAELTRTVPAARPIAGEPTELRVEVDRLADVLKLRTVVAAYEAVDLDITRPRALLSPDHLRTCVDAVQRARQTARPARFTGFRLSAAGRDSPELRRFRTEIARHTGLADDPDDGDMLLRLRRTPDAASGWQLLVRLTPRPLSARPWRVVDYPGAVNATIAAAVVAATEPTPEDRFVDLMCGSGTLVVERLARGRAARLVACDISPVALDAARANQRAARFKGRVEHIEADVRHLADRVAGFDRLVVNMPWGELVGSHADNDVLYPAVLGEARRVADDDAVLCVLTHDIRRFDRALAAVGTWTVTGSWRFFQKGHRPKLYRLEPD